METQSSFVRKFADGETGYVGIIVQGFPRWQPVYIVNIANVLYPEDDTRRSVIYNVFKYDGKYNNVPAQVEEKNIIPADEFNNLVKAWDTLPMEYQAVFNKL